MNNDIVHIQITSRDIIKAIEEDEIKYIDEATLLDFLRILKNARTICEEQIETDEKGWYWNDELFHVNNAIETLLIYENISQSSAN